MKKSIISVLLALSIIMAYTPLESSASSTQYNKNNAITYPVENGNIYIDVNGTLYDCDRTVTEVVIPEEVEGIAVTSIYTDAFNNCKELESLTFNSKINDLSLDAGYLYSCSKLTEIVIPEENDSFVFEDGVLYSKDMKTLYVSLPANESVTFTAPDTVETLGNSAFREAQYLEEVDLSKVGVTNLYYTFYGCKKLKKAVLSDSVQSLEYTFQGCSSLSDITLGSGIQKLEYAFYGCSVLNEIELPDGLQEMTNAPFGYCSALKSIEIPASVTKIDPGVFSYCKFMEAINVDTDNQTYESIDGVLFEKESNALFMYPEGRVEETYEIPEGTRCIRNSAFSTFWNTSKVGKVIVPSSMETIEQYAFPNGFSSTGELIYSEGIEKIDSTNCNQKTWSFSSITIPDSVTEINGSLFDSNFCKNQDMFCIKCMKGSYAEKYFKENMPEIKVIAGEKQAQVISCEDRTVDYRCEPFNLNATAKTSLTYSSSDEDIAEVSADGTVTVKGIGTVEITITAAEDSVYNEEVRKVTITIEKGGLLEQSIECDGSFDKYVDDAKFNLNASARTKLSYESKNTDVADVDEGGLVTIKGTGSAIIYVRAEESEDYAPVLKKVEINVSKRVQEISGVEDKYEFKVGDSLKLNPSAETDLCFESDGDAVSVTEDGTIKAVKEGSADIRVTAIESDTYESSSRVISINVSKKKQAVKSSFDTIDRKYSQTSISLNCSAKTALTYSSSDDSIVMVSKKGVAVLTGVGTAVITVTAASTDTYEGAVKKIAVHITKASQKITCESSFSKTYGASFRLGASAKTKLSYRSSNKNIAKVDSTGKVTVTGLGTATITITAKGTELYSSATKKVTVKTSLKKPTLTCTALSGHKNKITWGKVPGATGYKLYMYDSKTKKYKCVLTKAASIKSVTHKGLTKGKVYRYKVRAYRNVSGKKIYSPYSVIRKVKAK